MSKPHRDTNCKLCQLEDNPRSLNITVNPSLLCYRHQPVQSAASDRPPPRPTTPAF